MKVETFFEKFELFADAPNAIEKMRELVLGLAVQGRLVEQSHSDGDACAILEDIARASGDVIDWRTYDPSDPPLDVIPANWRWANTGWLCDLQTGKRMKGGAQDCGVISLGGEHLRPDGTVDYTVPRFVSESFFEEMRNGRVYLHDTLMVKDGATTGKAAFVTALPDNGCAAVNEHVFILRWHEPINKRFAFYFIRAFALTHIATKSAGVIGGIRREAVQDFPFPLPPISEQKRIVAKLDELMALCDALEAQQAERQTRHAALAHASLARFADQPTPDNLNFLFHKSYNLTPDELRKSILALAVQGKLVSQDPNDEPAEELIAVVRNAARESGYRGRTNSEDDDNPKFTAHMPSDLPGGWSSCPLEDLFRFVDYRGRTPLRRPAGVRLITAKNVKRGHVSNEPVEYIDESLYSQWMTRGYPKRGDLLFVTEGHTMGFVGTLNFDFTFALAQRTIDLQPFCDGYSPFYLHYLLSDPFQTALVDNTTGSAAQGIKAAKLKRIRVLVPPLAEQRRIVAKVDQLMALVDELEAQLAAERSAAAALMDALVAELAAPKSIPDSREQATPKNQTTSPRVRLHGARNRAAFTTFLAQCAKRHNRKVGAIASEKHAFLAEAYLRINCDGQWVRGQYGPYDEEGRRSAEELAADLGWFTITTSSGDFQPVVIGAKAAEAEAHLRSVVGDDFKSISRFTARMAQWTAKEAELYATLYAVWNDAIFEAGQPHLPGLGKPVTDDDIARLFLNWHPSKRERFTDADVRVGIVEMRRMRLVPSGQRRLIVDDSRLD